MNKVYVITVQTHYDKVNIKYICKDLNTAINKIEEVYGMTFDTWERIKGESRWFTHNNVVYIEIIEMSVI